MCRKPDSLVSFYLIYFYAYLVQQHLFYFDLLFTKTRQHLRRNLLFGLIEQFGHLEDGNTSVFLIVQSVLKGLVNVKPD